MDGWRPSETLGWDPEIQQGPWNSSTLCYQGKFFNFINICHFTPYPLLKLPFPLNDWYIFAMEQQRNSGLAWSGLELYRTYMWVPLPSYGSLRLNVGIFSHKKNSFQQGVCWSAAADVFSSFLRPFTLRKKVERRKDLKRSRSTFDWDTYFLHC